MRENEENMNKLGRALDEVLRSMYGQRIGFALFTFPFSGEGEVGDYISNGKREYMIKFMRELADRLESREYIPPTIGNA